MADLLLFFFFYTINDHEKFHWKLGEKSTTKRETSIDIFNQKSDIDILDPLRFVYVTFHAIKRFGF